MRIFLRRCLPLLSLAPAILTLCGQAAFAGQGQPERSRLMSDEQNQILDRVRAYATSYVSQLPNFVCVERTVRKLTEAKGKPYRTLDELESKVSFVDGKESYEKNQLQTIGKTQSKKGPVAQFELKGEFGTLMRGVLVLDHASFSWLGWDREGSVRVAIFAYRVARDQSTLVVTGGEADSAVVAYHGLVYAAPDTGAVIRITADAEDIPRRFVFSKAVSEVSYGAVEVGGKSYLLPLRSVYSGVSQAGLFRNESEFREYRKFGAETTIKFGEEK